MRAWILAGGRSRRFGSDKALARVGGETLLARTARVLAEAGFAVSVVARHSRGLDLPELIEPEGPRHPLHGVATVLALGEDAFFSPVDLPDLAVEQVRRLRDARAVAVGQPLLGVIPASLAGRAAAFAGDGRSVREFVAELPAIDVGEVTNLNRA